MAKKNNLPLHLLLPLTTFSLVLRSAGYLSFPVHSMLFHTLCISQAAASAGVLQSLPFTLLTYFKIQHRYSLFQETSSGHPAQC